MHPDIDANREFLGDDAVYVRPENEDDLVKALEYAVKHPDRMSEFVSVNYAKLLEKYTWDKVAVKYVEYLRSIGVE